MQESPRESRAMELSPELVDRVATVCRENLAREFDNSMMFGPMCSD